MNQNRKDQRESTSGRGSVMDDKESFEHGSGPSDMAKGMGSSGERGKGSSGERPQPSRAPERGRSESEDK